MARSVVCVGRPLASIFWLARPLLLPRWLTLLKGREDLLVTRVDLATGIGLGVIVVALIFGGYAWTVSDYPYNVPLQSGTVKGRSAAIRSARCK